MKKFIIKHLEWIGMVWISTAVSFMFISYSVEYGFSLFYAGAFMFIQTLLCMCIWIIVAIIKDVKSL